MNGRVLHEYPIAVDYFGKSEEASLYFLTHMHSDHTVGLSKFWQKKIYCSSVTAKLLHFKLMVDQDYIIPLEELQPHVISFRNGRQHEFLTVTVVPANHCPGSCMFLFETVDKRILYTGDFRPNERIFEIGEKLWGRGSGGIDSLYLDNTYCEPSCVLPSKEDAIEKIVKVCKRHLDCTIFIGVSWTGHEELIEAVATELMQYLVVSFEQMDLLKLIEAKDVFTTDNSMGNIHVIPSYFVNSKWIKNMDEGKNCIGILPTGRKCHENSVSTSSSLIYTIPYSNHASFAELWEFVQCVYPRKIWPIVPARTENRGMESAFRADMSQFNCLLNREKKVSTEIYPAKKRDARWNIDRLTQRYLYDLPPATKRRKSHYSAKTVTQRPCGVVFDDEDGEDDDATDDSDHDSNDDP